MVHHGMLVGAASLDWCVEVPPVVLACMLGASAWSIVLLVALAASLLAWVVAAPSLACLGTDD
jgi:hypothetical protein